MKRITVYRGGNCQTLTVDRPRFAETLRSLRKDGWQVWSVFTV